MALTDQKFSERLSKVPAGATGQNVKVGIVDSGFFPHPYYAANHFAYVPTPTASAPDPTNDTNGHGTAISFNVFAVAPRRPSWASSTTPQPQDAIEEAADAGVDIISCSWGGTTSSRSRPGADDPRHRARGQDRAVCHGNGQHAWPGSMPEVISIGGVFADSE